MEKETLAALISGGSSLAGSLISGIGGGYSSGKQLEYMRAKDKRDEEFRNRQLAAQNAGTNQGNYWDSVANLARNAQAGAEKAKMYQFTRSLLG